MAGLRHPIVRAAPQPAEAISKRSRLGADQHREPWERKPEPLEVLEPRERGVDNQRVQPQRGQPIRSSRVADHLQLPAKRHEAPIENRDETIVLIDQRHPDRGSIAWQGHRHGSVKRRLDEHGGAGRAQLGTCSQRS